LKQEAKSSIKAQSSYAKTRSGSKLKKQQPEESQVKLFNTEKASLLFGSNQRDAVKHLLKKT
jgi:hypothetical protein